MEIRPFRSGDEAAVVTLWNACVAGCFAAGSLTPETFQRDIMGKHYFDPEGLILAFQESKPVAFVHAGFKSSDFVNPNPLQGTISMLAVAKGQEDAGTQALTKAICYLLRRGARQIEAFAIDALFLGAPFYTCLYGAEKAGMDELHPGGQEVLQRCHFHPAMGSVIMHCPLQPEYHPLKTPDGLHLLIEPWNGGGLPLDRNPSETYGIPEPMRRAYLVDSTGARKVRIAFWHLDRYNQSTGDHMAVISAVGADTDMRGTGAAVTLMQEVFRILRSEGATNAALGTTGPNGRAVSYYRKLGYVPLRNAFTYYLDWRYYNDFP